VIEERQNGTGASNVSYQFVWGAGYVDDLVLRDTYSGGVKTQRLYAQQNANDDVTALINTSGQVQERYLYDPYGAVTVTDASWNPRTGNQSSFAWRYMHQGGRLDGVTGWYEFRNRDLIPSEGRWAERDPLGIGGGDTDLYAYAGNDPSGLTDPSGLKFGRPGKAGDAAETALLQELAARLGLTVKDLDGIKKSSAWKCIAKSKTTVHVRFHNDLNPNYGGLTGRNDDGTITVQVNPDRYISRSANSRRSPKVLLDAVLHELIHAALLLGCKLGQINDRQHDYKKNEKNYEGSGDLNKYGQQYINDLILPLRRRLPDELPEGTDTSDPRDPKLGRLQKR
jgi:RHS repeat-associated protein